ncbi:hypothetical protein TTHERM_01081680 (macronuclear) [Tetrahymena thermophila SB210]|uniref:cellulase n=1 Tax=Tetrahymena thermophila (strain SB210) TaxID=312017 RepID=Q22C01_TETTS|nr:hypothetical protein TTHERM_01081680 [Tetrahymena thermophila SB210]EAR82808.2 hypothetical protein TTHERM_01081680 [Tetrahymena thermophila SB210]|eukprot:XP_001030471.2 hypothetical protein TTHERM_01081680 [Tetrahymena thermophila SB210]
MRKKNILLLNIICLVLISQAIAQNYDYNTANVCDTGSFGKSQDQVAYMCTHQALGSCQLQQAVQADGYSSFAEYGFGGYGSNPPSNYCCRCFQIQVQDGDAPAKDIIVQGINTGGDVNSNQFDLSMIAGGFGANNGCANKVFAWNGGAWDGRAGAAQYSQSAAGNWCSDPTSDNSRCQNAYSGGITKKSDCAKLPNNNLTQLCEYSFDSKWRTSNGNRDTIMKEVRCPAGLIKLSGCNRDDSSLPYPSGKLSASDPSVMRGKLTHMWDCCKPSCSWTANVLKANGTAVMSCDASGTNILGTNTSFQCTNFTCDPTCKTCSASNDANKCTSCNTGHYLSSNPGQCTACTPSLNCKECSDSSTCKTCQTGYTLQIDGSCKQPCDQSCKTCSTPQDATQCTSCNDGYYLSGSSVGTCSKCPSGCTSCTSNSNCLACSDNYVLISGSCQACNSPCLSCKTDTNTCTSCVKGYVLNGNICEATCDSTCKTCSKNQDATQCTSCNSGFYLDGTTVGSCVQCSQNCSSCTSKNSCQTCINNTILVSGQCLSCTSPCQTCQTSVTNCLSCVQGYTLNGNTCTPINTGDCHPSCQTCSRPNDQNSCTSCPTGYLVLGGNCQPCQSPCQNCSGNPNSCTSCIANYSLSGNTCVGSNQDQTQCHPSCKTCSVQYDQNACTSCFDGFLILGNGNCQPCQPPCQNCSGNPNNCTQCASGYAVQKGTCLKILNDNTQCDSTCQTCTLANNANACASCVSGFVLASDNSCQACQSPCQTCSGSTTSCLTCIASYNLQGNQCVPQLLATVSMNSSILKLSLMGLIAIFILLI